jgi:hypothetical protein
MFKHFVKELAASSGQTVVPLRGDPGETAAPAPDSPSGGRRYLERALALDPSSPVTLNNLARSWMSNGNWQTAVAYLQRARAPDGADRRIATNLETASVRAEGARTQTAEMANHAAPEPWIERATPSVQVLHTRPEPSASAPSGTGGLPQSSIGASLPSPTQHTPALDD